MSDPKTCAVIGGGPAGLMAAETLAEVGCAVTVYDRMPSLGRKFLMAGIGGLNLTHSEEVEPFLARYRGGVAMREMVQAFGPDALRAWCEELGQETFVGSSGRVFPKSFKTSPLLRAWLSRLDRQGVAVKLRHRWVGWEGDALLFDAPEGRVSVRADAVVLAMGGGSWPRLGSDGSWQTALSEAGVATLPFKPSNCGFVTGWREHVGERFAGTPLKTIAASFGGETVRGEVMVTEDGIEGGAVYALSPLLRDAVEATGSAVLHLDLKPDMSAAQISAKLSRKRTGDSLSNRLRKAGLPPVAIAVLREGLHPLPEEADDLARAIKAVPITLSGVRGLERAISSAGGVAAEALDPRLMLDARPGVFAAGEMLDWEAPTGGYLLQACMASGRWAANGALDWLRSSKP